MNIINLTHIIPEAIERVRKMETYFDALQQIWHSNPQLLHEDGAVRDMLRTLIDYYENGQWMEDYRLDEQGGLPADLKRGILSEDALYDFLSELNI